MKYGIKIFDYPKQPDKWRWYAFATYNDINEAYYHVENDRKQLDAISWARYIVEERE